jgi:phosphomannomutase
MRAPEPIAPNLGELLALMEGGGYDIGLATDGDGDRFGLVNERGEFMTQLQTFALLVRYLLEVRGERGPIVRSITTTKMVDILGERYDCPVYETPVGFKHLAPRMIGENALIAGEESGGYAFRGHIPERDGVLSGLLLLDYVVQTGKRPSELLADLYNEVGAHEYDRIDVTLRADERDELAERVAQAAPESIAGIPVVERDTMDGFRFKLEGGWWLLLRFSGTEPLLRIYAEMPSQEQLQQALQDGQELAGVDL